MMYSKQEIESLFSEYGSPLYVFDEKGFAENYHKLHTAMADLYGKYQISYSFKTNYTPYVCRIVKQLGAYAEVVSGMEYTLARELGYEDRHIIFNGPEKGTEAEAAFRRGCILNADSLDELNTYCKIAEMDRYGEFKIGLRVNLDVGQGFVSRFGMDEDDLKAAFQRVSKIGSLKIVGLHCHISRCRGKEAWRKRTEYMLGLVDRLFDNPPEYVDLGSGMFGSMEPSFAAQFGEIPSYEEYAQVTAGLFAEHFCGQDGPTLITEPGTTLINRFVECIAKVESIKSINGHHFAVLNASIHNLGETCILKRLPVRVISGGEPQIRYDSIDLTGYTCLEQDVLLPAFEGKLAKGDYVIFENTGGYSTVLKPPFIRPDCAMVAKKSDGEYVLIKKPETYDDVFGTYLFKGGE